MPLQRAATYLLSIIFWVFLLVLTNGQILDAQRRTDWEDYPNIPPGEEFREEEVREGLGDSERDWAIEHEPTEPIAPRETEREGLEFQIDERGESRETLDEQELSVPRTATTDLPVYPGDKTLLPHERVALRLVTEGERELMQDNLDPAQDRFEAAVELAPFQPYSYYFLGRIAFKRGDHKQAIAFLRKAEVLLANKDLAWLGETASLRGVVLEDYGEYDQARVAYRRCLEVAPDNLRAMSALARLGED